MKKNALLVITALCSSFGHSQIYVETSCGDVDASSENVSGTTVYENGIPPYIFHPNGPQPENHTHTKFYYKNTTDAQQVISLRRLRVSVPNYENEMADILTIQTSAF